MPDSFTDDLFATSRIRDPRQTPQSLSPIGQYSFAFVFVALATTLAVLIRHLISVPNITLIYVLPVVVAATLFGWGPSLFAVALGVAAYVFFFTAPPFSLTIAGQVDISAVVVFFVIASIVASVTSASSRRAFAAREDAERAQALQTLAHAVIERRPQSEIVQAAATALHRIFRAPTAVLIQRKDSMEAVATAGNALITQADRDVARGALASHVNTRGKLYPYERTSFDFWPVSTRAGCSYVLGVDFAHAARERPSSPDLTIEVIAAYVAASSSPGAV